MRTFQLVDKEQAKEIGRRIAETRQIAGMTQAQLAELLNVSARSVQDYELGLRVPWKHFIRLEEIFAKPLRWFMHGDVTLPTVPMPLEQRLDRMLDELRAQQRETMAMLETLRENQRIVMARLEDQPPAPRR